MGVGVAEKKNGLHINIKTQKSPLRKRAILLPHREE